MFSRRAHGLLFLILASGVAPALAMAAQDTSPAAVVTDTTGASTVVSALIARYCATGQWFGTAPTTARAALVFVLSGTEGRVKTTDTLEVPFATVRNIVLASDKDLWKKAEAADAPASVEIARVERRDGSQVRVISTAVGQKGPGGSVHYDLTDSLEETAPGGSPLKRGPHSRVWIADGELQGRSLVLCSSEGTAQAPSGKTGKYSIVVSEVRSIGFK